MSTKQLHRKVRFKSRVGDQMFFEIRSLTPGSDKKYHPVIDVGTKEFFCDCRDHFHRQTFCKHLKRAFKNCVTYGELPRDAFSKIGVECCLICDSSEDVKPLADDLTGRPVPKKFICLTCIQNGGNHD